MAKLNVMGDFIQIRSSLTEEEIKVVQYYKPEVLKLKDEKDNEIFGVTICNGDPHASKYGITFCNKDSNGRMFVTVENPVNDHSDPAQERKEISKLFAQLINNLQIVETQVANAKPEITALVQNANEAITFVETDE